MDHTAPLLVSFLIGHEFQKDRGVAFVVDWVQSGRIWEYRPQPNPPSLNRKVFSHRGLFDVGVHPIEVVIFIGSRHRRPHSWFDFRLNIVWIKSLETLVNMTWLIQHILSVVVITVRAYLRVSVVP